MGCVQLKPKNEIKIQSNLHDELRSQKETNILHLIKDIPKLSTVNDQLPTTFKLNRRNDQSDENQIIIRPFLNTSHSPLTNQVSKQTISINSHPSITEIDKMAIKQSLSNHFLFKDKASEIINLIINSLEIIEIEPGVILFKQGEKGNSFYIIKKGKLELETEYGMKKFLSSNETFGELALIESRKRTATVRSIEKSVLYCLNGKFFRQIVKKINQSELNSRLSFLKLVPIFSKL